MSKKFIPRAPLPNSSPFFTDETVYLPPGGKRRKRSSKVPSSTAPALPRVPPVFPFDRILASARRIFSREEADLYRQGNRLVVRLRALQFLSNQSVLRDAQEPLLEKVARVVAQFEDPSVLIEGHSDSDGKKAFLQRLSEKRAQVVSDYLVGHGVIDSSRVVAVGYGLECPVASNKSAAGKAQNRRIDVNIMAHSAGTVDRLVGAY